MPNDLWIVAAASVRGRGHETTQTPCQDKCAVELSKCGQWIALAASDGAGSASKSEIGAQITVDAFAQALISLHQDLEVRAPGAWVSDFVIETLLNIRESIRNTAKSDDISAYHCTLTAALIGPTGGFTVHLGDGAIFGGASDSKTSTTIDLTKDYFVSTAQNGEYANETVFITERDWVKNLRIEAVPSVDWVILGTDGGMALAMQTETTPKTGFVVPTLRNIINTATQQTRHNALFEILNDKQADKLTNDDKTLVVAIRSRYKDVIGNFSTTETLISSQSSSKQSSGNQSKSQPILATPPKQPSSKNNFHQRKNPNLIKYILLILFLVFLASLITYLSYQHYNNDNPKQAPIKKQPQAETPNKLDTLTPKSSQNNND